MIETTPFATPTDAVEYEEWLDMVQADSEGREEYRAACNEIE